MSKKIFVIPDTQVRKGVRIDHLSRVGQYAVDKRPDVIVHLGDHWDFPSLSSYDRGKASFEGRRYAHDVDAGNKALSILESPILAEVKRSRRTRSPWNPRLVLLRGNHEQRVLRAIENDPILEGTMGYQDFADEAWETHDFLEPVWIEGFCFSHYFQNQLSSRPIGGSIENRLSKIGCSFVAGHEQVLKMGVQENVAGRRWGFVFGNCLAPHHKVLTSDLRYVPLGDVKVGDKLVSFDENTGESTRRGRAWKTGTVEAVRISKRAVKRITFDDGKVIIATPDHQWLTRVGGPLAQRENETYKWRTTNDLKVGTRVAAPLAEWDTDNSRDAGYLAGLYDGEGCLTQRETSAGYVNQLSLSQKPGAVWDEAVRITEALCGIDTIGSLNSRGVMQGRLRGGVPSIAKLLGQIRPVRLLEKFSPEGMGQVTCSADNNRRVVSIEDAGESDVVEIEIDAKTMVVEGQLHHNCYQHDEAYRGSQSNREKRGILVLNDVSKGDCDPMVVSLDWLAKRYPGKKVVA